MYYDVCEINQLKLLSFRTTTRAQPPCAKPHDQINCFYSLTAGTKRTIKIVPSKKFYIYVFTFLIPTGIYWDTPLMLSKHTETRYTRKFRAMFICTKM